MYRTYTASCMLSQMELFGSVKRKMLGRETSMSIVRSDDVAEHLARDKETARSVVRAAGEELQRGYVEPVAMDITGAPSELRTFRKYKQQQQFALTEIRTDLYFRKIEVEVKDHHGDQEDRTYLITKGRYAPGIQDLDWFLVSWTLPVTQLTRPFLPRLSN